MSLSIDWEGLAQIENEHDLLTANIKNLELQREDLIKRIHTMTAPIHQRLNVVSKAIIQEAAAFYNTDYYELHGYTQNPSYLKEMVCYISLHDKEGRGPHLSRHFSGRFLTNIAITIPREWLNKTDEQIVESVKAAKDGLHAQFYSWLGSFMPRKENFR